MKESWRQVSPLAFSTHRGAVLLLSVILAGQAGGHALASPETTDEITVKLSRAVPFVAQSTNGTCWLACAAMVRQYYGQKTDEKTVNKNVRDITLSNRGGQLRANKRECMIALANNAGLQESVLHQAVAVGEDVTNRLAELTNSPNVGVATNGSQVNMSANLSTATTNKPASWLFSGGKLNVNPIPFLRGKTEEYLWTRNPDLLVEALKNQEPGVIVCKLGAWSKEEHAMVVTGITYRNAVASKSAEKIEIVSVEVLDPAGDSGATTTKPGEYLKTNLRAVLTKSWAEKILKDESDTLTHKP